LVCILNVKSTVITRVKALQYRDMLIFRSTMED